MAIGQTGSYDRLLLDRDSRMFLLFGIWVSARIRGKRDPNDCPYLPACKLLFFENFSDPDPFHRWVPTNSSNYSGLWVAQQTYSVPTRKGERALVTENYSQNYAISHQFRHPIETRGKLLLVQYEVRSQYFFDCTSAVMTLYTDPAFNSSELNNDTSWFLSFGPYRCGDINESRFHILKDGTVHKMKHPHWIPVDTVTHLHTLIIRKNGTFEVLLDDKSIRNGTFSADFDPPLFEAPTIDDPRQKKPPDWDDRVYVPDPNGVKPADWDDDAPERIPYAARLTPPPGWLVDEPPRVPRTDAKQPDDWDEDKMGKWRPPSMRNPACAKAPGCGPYNPPMVPNPKARGKWKAKYVRNPNFKGEWKPAQIPNPSYHGQSTEFVIPPLTAIGFNIWAKNRDVAFTNIAIANEEEGIRAWNREDFVIRQRRQIGQMSPKYEWIDTILPDDELESGFLGETAFKWRELKRKWKKSRNKTMIFAVSGTILSLMVPVVWIMCNCCDDDPFAKIKDD
jgi:calnexin